MGRPRQFDESKLLDAAIELFWSNGFDDTSVEDVSLVAGVGNGSIYAAYSSKRGLFLAAFERYCERRATFVCETVLAAPGSARMATRTLLRAMVEDCVAQPDRRGCLMINSIAALSGRIPEVAELAARTGAAMERGVAERLSSCAPDGASAEVATLSAHIIVTAQGLILWSRMGVPADRLHEIAEVSVATLPSAWADQVGATAAARKAYAG
ncbi:TetR/AcrR family transcriptional regulator [Nocardia sp. CA-107356]|uniref:TetR/AcrR family transcriptional regulator n=1 Tax=Nocardia sp. CA-107356 TaxID=3239972 RepID=UPI003D8E7203